MRKSTTTKSVKITDMELQVLKAIDASEYGSELGDAVWTLTIADNSNLEGRAISGLLSSLRKKRLVSLGNSDGGDTVEMTQLGMTVYSNAVGRPKKPQISQKSEVSVDLTPVEQQLEDRAALRSAVAALRWRGGSLDKKDADTIEALIDRLYHSKA